MSNKFNNSVVVSDKATIHNNDEVLVEAPTTNQPSKERPEQISIIKVAADKLDPEIDSEMASDVSIDTKNVADQSKEDFASGHLTGSLETVAA